MSKTDPNFNHILIQALSDVDVDALDFRELLEKIADNFGNLDSDIESFDKIELSLKLEPYEVEQYSQEYLLHKGIESRYILIVRVATEATVFNTDRLHQIIERIKCLNISNAAREFGVHYDNPEGIVLYYKFLGKRHKVIWD